MAQCLRELTVLPGFEFNSQHTGQLTTIYNYSLMGFSDLFWCADSHADRTLIYINLSLLGGWHSGGKGRQISLVYEQVPGQKKSCLRK